MNILTIDVEEWFHLHENVHTETEADWLKFESRINNEMDRIFEILHKTNSKATFFCLGWIAKRYPELIKKIDAHGFEIGSHSHLHQLAYNQSPDKFKSDVETSIKVLEDLIGKKIRIFRAPGFSIRDSNVWAFEILASLGIEIDCSIFPAKHPNGGFPNFKEHLPSVVSFQGIEMKELPINFVRFLGRSTVFSGGGFFRFYAYPFIRYWSENSDYIMAYFHPRDLDSDLPKINGLSLYQSFRLYFGLKNAEKKMTDWLSDFDFIDIKTADSIIDWERAKRIYF